MSLLFDRNIKAIGKHLGNIFSEEEPDKFVKFATAAADNKESQVEFYNLDVIISVGYRVKSKLHLFYYYSAKKQKPKLF